MALLPGRCVVLERYLGLKKGRMRADNRKHAAHGYRGEGRASLPSARQSANPVGGKEMGKICLSPPVP